MPSQTLERGILGMMAPFTTRSCFQISNTVPRTRTHTHCQTAGALQTQAATTSMFPPSHFLLHLLCVLKDAKGPVLHVFTEETGRMFSSDCSPLPWINNTASLPFLTRLKSPQPIKFWKLKTGSYLLLCSEFQLIWLNFKSVYWSLLTCG